MNELISIFKTKAGLARALGVSGPAVCRAFTRNEIPATWVPKLIQKGISVDQLSKLPISKTAADILSAIPQDDNH